MKLVKSLILIFALAFFILAQAKLSRKIKSEASASATTEKSKDKNNFVGTKFGMTVGTVNRFFQFLLPQCIRKT